MSYVFVFVQPVPTANKEKYIKHVQIVADVLKEAGALQIVECWGDDVPDGEVTSFIKAVQKRDDETVAFSWILWPDKETCDKGMKKLLEDPRTQEDVNPMPFDGKRIIYGGFQMILEN